MPKQEQELHDTWEILRLEQEKEKLRQEYLERIADINLEILQLQNKISNTESPVLPEGDKIVSVKDKFFRTMIDAGKETTK